MEKITKNQKYLIAFVTATAAAASFIFFIPQKTNKIPEPVAATRQIKHAIQAKPHKKPVYPDTVPGKIVTLKKLIKDYAFDYYKAFSPKVREGLGFPKKITFGYVEQRIEYEVKRIKQGKLIVYSIWDNKTNKFAGTLQIRDRSDEDPGQFGMWLNESYWGGGRIQEAMLLISKAYFDANPTIHSFIAYARPWNVRSYKSMEKFGFKNIGETKYKDEKAFVFELTRTTIEKKLQK